MILPSMRGSSGTQSDTLTFGPFTLMPGRRRLEKAGSVIELGGRALDLLIVLAERAGEVVSKRELISRVWPDVVVSEGSLRFHINALRKTLADLDPTATYVQNVVRR